MLSYYLAQKQPLRMRALAIDARLIETWTK
jgi:hypothetical protein